MPPKLKKEFHLTIRMKNVVKMYYPNCETIQHYAQLYDTVPLYSEIFADVATPILVLQRLLVQSCRCFLLESVEGGETWGRYSFLGFEPELRLRCKDSVVTVEGDEQKTIHTDKPLDVVRSYLSRFHAPKIPGMPPFCGGFVGYYGYAMMGYAEPSLNIKRGGFDDYDLMLFKKVIAFDHLKQKICVIVNMETDHVMENYGRAIAEIERIIHIITDTTPNEAANGCVTSGFVCNTDEETYCRNVEKTRAYIRDGDIFQAVLSRRFEADFQGSLLNPYRVLRTTNPSPYMVFMQLDDTQIMCSSPETLIRLQNGLLSTFPVAGSRPRGRDEAHDRALETELLADEKELSEHNMLVDLGRNDLGRICDLNSIKVTDYMMIHRYSKIMHIASRVDGTIRSDCDACDAIEAILPAGTLSGAPKIRACEIIEQMETVPRGIYGGALGYIDFTGNLDTCIAIRMAVKKDNKVYVQAGGGIVADSVPRLEYEESGHKAQAVINALLHAAEVDER